MTGGSQAPFKQDKDLDMPGNKYSKKLFEQLLDRGLISMTGIKKNMKNRLIPLFDKLMLRKLALIESLNNKTKKFS